MRFYLNFLLTLVVISSSLVIHSHAQFLDNIFSTILPSKPNIFTRSTEEQLTTETPQPEQFFTTTSSGLSWNPLNWFQSTPRKVGVREYNPDMDLSTVTL